MSEIKVGEPVEVQTDAGVIRGIVEAVGPRVVSLRDSDGDVVRVDAELVLRSQPEPVAAPARTPRPKFLVRLYTFQGVLSEVREVGSRGAAVRVIAKTGGIRRGEVLGPDGRVETIDGGRAIEECNGVTHHPVWRDTRASYNGAKVRASRSWYGSAAA
jgi:hypothetical protein